VVSAHGGTISVSSLRHEGTEFKVRLHIARAAAEPQPATNDGGRGLQPHTNDGGRGLRHA